MFQYSTHDAWQAPFDAAVVVPTLLRPSLERAVRSIYAQDLDGRIQILVGVDVPAGDETLLGRLAAECPARMALTICALPYSTSARHGGLHPNRYSGALRSILTLAANSRRVAYLDDDNWWAPSHLAMLVAAIEGHDWAFSGRIFVDPETGETIAPDDWESVGPGAGVFAERFGGFVDPSSLMIDKLACHEAVGSWSLAAFADGSGEDRLVLERLARLRWRATGGATSFYAMHAHDRNHHARLQRLRERGLVTPAERRAGIRPLAGVIGHLRPGEGVPPGASLDPVTEALLARLKPREIVLLGPADMGLGASLAAALARLDLPALVLVEGGSGPGTIAWPAELGDAAAVLAATPVAVDLVHVGGSRDPAAGFALLRRGGMLMGEGEGLAAAAIFAEAAGLAILPVELGSHRAWLIQKG